MAKSSSLLSSSSQSRDKHFKNIRKGLVEFFGEMTKFKDGVVCEVSQKKKDDDEKFVNFAQKVRNELAVRRSKLEKEEGCLVLWENNLDFMEGVYRKRLEDFQKKKLWRVGGSVEKDHDDDEDVKELAKNVSDSQKNRECLEELHRREDELKEAKQTFLRKKKEFAEKTLKTTIQREQMEANVEYEADKVSKSENRLLHVTRLMDQMEENLEELKEDVNDKIERFKAVVDENFRQRNLEKTYGQLMDRVQVLNDSVDMKRGEMEAYKVQLAKVVQEREGLEKNDGDQWIYIFDFISGFTDDEVGSDDEEDNNNTEMKETKTRIQELGELIKETYKELNVYIRFDQLLLLSEKFGLELAYYDGENFVPIVKGTGESMAELLTDVLTKAVLQQQQQQQGNNSS